MSCFRILLVYLMHHFCRLGSLFYSAQHRNRFQTRLQTSVFPRQPMKLKAQKRTPLLLFLTFTFTLSLPPCLPCRVMRCRVSKMPSVLVFIQFTLYISMSLSPHIIVLADDTASWAMAHWATTTTFVDLFYLLDIRTHTC